MDRVDDFIERHKRHHEEERKLHEEFRKRQRELHRQVKEMHRHKAEFHRYHRHIKYSRPFILLFNLLLWFLLFRFAGLQALSIFFALLISMGGLMEFFFLRRIENRILKPIDKLQKGVEDIAGGNYDVRVESDVTNEISMLIDSFNEMARKLKEGETVKAEYEENRKDLIANISHDLKTPITSIQGYIEAIMEDKVGSPENLRKYLKIIYNNSSYINKLVDDLFLFSKLDMQKLEFQFAETRVRPFVQDLMEEFKIELEEKKIEFLFSDKMEEERSFSIDGKRLHQVFRNIIGNAIKYGPEENLSIKAEACLKEGGLCIRISDNGPGIPEDKLPHVFDRFYRIDMERTKDFMSTGLGLAIAKELVEAHGGSIDVSSVEGRGTCFTVLLPCLEKSL